MDSKIQAFQTDAEKEIQRILDIGQIDSKYYHMNTDQINSFFELAHHHQRIKKETIIAHMTETNFWKCMLPYEVRRKRCIQTFKCSICTDRVKWEMRFMHMQSPTHIKQFLNYNKIIYIFSFAQGSAKFLDTYLTSFECRHT